MKRRLPSLLTAFALLPVALHAQEVDAPTANNPAAKPERTGYFALRAEALPRDANGFLAPAVWDLVKAEAAARPVSNEASILKDRPEIQAYYAKFKDWQAPASLPVQPGRLRNLADAPTAPRFTVTDKVWPTKPGEASICLWEDDKLAAMSLGVDDNCATDIPYWKELSKKHGGLNITWNLIAYNIGGAVSKGRGASAGSYETWQGMLKDGYRLASHSMTHNHDPVPADGWPGPDWEAAESRDELQAGLRGHKIRTFVYPGAGVHVFGILGGYTPKSTWRPSLVKYFVAARGAGGEAITEANMIDYFNIHATTGAVPQLIDTTDPKFKAQNLNNLFDADPKSPYHKAYRGWANVFIHFINNGKDFEKNPFNVAYEKVLTFYDQHRTDLWTGFFDDVALYGQERDTATLTTDQAANDKIAFTLTTKMEPTIFDYPLTVKVRLPDGWKTVSAKQNGAALAAQFLTQNNAPYALVKAVPDKGQVTLTAK